MSENKVLKGINFPGLEGTYYVPEAIAVEDENGYVEIKSYISDTVEVENLDATLTKEGYAADAKAVGEALSAKAPAGYGLGETGSRLLELADIDGTRTKMIPTGWYHLDPMLGGITIDGYKMNPVGVRVEPYSGGYMMITIIYQGQPVVRRNFVTGTWGPWEWISPPYKFGEVYRTTERFAGYPVYAVNVACGMVVHGETAVTVTKGITDDPNFSLGYEWSIVGYDGGVVYDAVYIGVGEHDMLAKMGEYPIWYAIKGIKATWSNAGLTLTFEPTGNHSMNTTEGNMFVTVKFIKREYF